MIRIAGKIPIIIYPVFWLVAALIGYVNSGSFLGTLIWVGIILLSLIVHELGHAITALFFGKKPKIELVAMGGVTTYDSDGLKYYQQFLITFCGPLFGFLLFLAAYLILYFHLLQNPLGLQIVNSFKWANLIWTIANLLPIIPLDGGQLLRITLEAFFGLKGFKIALFLGMVCALAMSFLFFIFRNFLLGSIFFLLTFQSFDLFRRTKHLVSVDRKEEYAKMLKEGEEALEAGKIDEAWKLFTEVRERTKAGILHGMATRYLATICLEKEEGHEAYELLLEIKEQLADEALCFLHKLAFDEGNFSLVAELSSQCYQLEPSKEVALRNARSFAILGNPKPAGGWLQRAGEFAGVDISLISHESCFDKVRSNPLFRDFLK